MLVYLLEQQAGCTRALKQLGVGRLVMRVSATSSQMPQGGGRRVLFATDQGTVRKCGRLGCFTQLTVDCCFIVSCFMLESWEAIVCGWDR